LKKVRLGEVVGEKGVFVDGDWIESKDQDPNGEIRLVQLADIGIGRFKDKSDRFLTKEKAEELGCTYLREGDLLLARLPDPLGRTCVFPSFDYECVTAVDICIIRVERTDVDKNWLMYALNSPMMKDEIDKYTTGTTRKRISRKNLQKIEIPLPSLSEQKAIVAKLDRAQRLIDIDKEMLAKYDELIQSVFLEMFGDPVKNDKEWDTLKLGDYCNVVRGSSPRPKGDPRYFDGPVPRLMVEDVTRDGMYVTPQIDSLTEEGAEKSRWMKKGDVVVAASGKPGVPTILQVNCCIHDGFIGLRDLSEEINSRRALQNPHGSRFWFINCRFQGHHHRPHS
jgi:type I restriction enzyme S subunit